MLFDNPVANAQAEPGSFPDLFGGEERVKDTIGLMNSVTIVAERNLDKIALAGGSDVDSGAAARFPHRVIGVVEDVEEHLLKLLRVPNDERQVVLKLLRNRDPAAMEVVGAQLDRPLQDRVQLDRLALWRHLAGKAQKVL